MALFLVGKVSNGMSHGRDPGRAAPGTGDESTAGVAECAAGGANAGRLRVAPGSTLMDSAMASESA
jgi:hypothetical protein